MNYSESVLLAIKKIQKETGFNLFESLSSFCEEHDLDVSEVVKQLDSNVIQQLKEVIAENRYVQKSVYRKKTVSLEEWFS